MSVMILEMSNIVILSNEIYIMYSASAVVLRNAVPIIPIFYRPLVTAVKRFRN